MRRECCRRSLLHRDPIEEWPMLEARPDFTDVVWRRSYLPIEEWLVLEARLSLTDIAWRSSYLPCVFHRLTVGTRILFGAENGSVPVEQNSTCTA